MTEAQTQGIEETIATLCRQRDGAVAELRGLGWTLDGQRETAIKQRIERLNEAIWRMVLERARGEG